MRNIFQSRVVAVTGGAAAIALIAGGSAVAGSMVTSQDIKNNTIRSADIRDGAVSGKDLRNGVEASIRRRATKTYVDRKVAGVEGAGTPGKDGADGVSGLAVVGPEVTVPAGATNFVATAECGEGKSIVGGGFKVSNGPEVNVKQSMPSGLTEGEGGVWNGTGWTVQLDNPGAGNAQVAPYAICALAK